MTRILSLVLHCTVLAGSFPAPATAQPAARTAPRQEARILLGHAAFVDESPLHHVVLGGGVRTRLTPRLRLGAEVLHMWGPGTDRDWVLEGSLEVDLGDPDGRAVPYLVAAGGLLAHREAFPGRRSLTATEPAVSGGAGVRLRVTDRFVLAPEFRVGVELHARVVLGAGYRF
ncbi:MAG TPA: hypothetical protein VNI83_08530 [Vicinamibacterales bacterium]|nr:hypothetical protein [Vicinamibacterales bacterium]